MIKAPFPWFGGKSRVSSLVWERFGAVSNYVEPFFGGGAILLGRPVVSGTETVNDIDGFLANFWRAVKSDPDAVARWADNPVNECDLHARHLWLVGQTVTLAARLCAEPDWHDAKIAGWWCWGLCCWIGSGWCSGDGPWSAVDGVLVNGTAGQGINRKLPHLGTAGQGINRKLPHLGNAGRGINRQLPHLGNAGRGKVAWMRSLADRLRGVRVACGDWQRVCGPSVTFGHGLTGVFLDPPYADEADVYRQDHAPVGDAVREWALANGDNPKMRIALCGYEGEHAMPDGWQVVAWKAKGGYAGQAQDHDNPNARRERIWFSPYCDGGRQNRLFA